MKTSEMIGILEGIVRDQSAGPTARCTAIRTLLRIMEEDRGGDWSDELGEELERLIKTEPRGTDGG